MIITLNNDIQNVSLQVGDKAYFSVVTDLFLLGNNGAPVNRAGSPELIGEITDVGANFVEIANPVASLTTLNNENDFIMFSKDTRVNKNSLIGYYAEVKLNNDSTDKIELFSLSSEVIKSSK